MPPSARITRKRRNVGALLPLRYNGCRSRMAEKICIVTGASSGIGKATAAGLAARGFRVVMVCRNPARGDRARQEILAGNGALQVDLMIADLASQQAIRRLAEEIERRYSRLDVLVNNAGLMIGRRSLTPDGLEATFGVNYLAGFLLTHLLLDMLRSSAPARIVNISSVAHLVGKINLDDLQSERSYQEFLTYASSKLANVLFTYELARRLEGTGITANCLHPGGVATNLGSRPVGFAGVIWRIVKLFAKSPRRGARTPIFLACSPTIEGVSGKYFVGRRPRSSSRLSYDRDLARRLWDASARLAGLSPP